MTPVVDYTTVIDENKLKAKSEYRNNYNSRTTQVHFCILTIAAIRLSRIEHFILISKFIFVLLVLTN